MYATLRYVTYVTLQIGTNDQSKLLIFLGYNSSGKWTPSSITNGKYCSSIRGSDTKVQMRFRFCFYFVPQLKCRSPAPLIRQLDVVYIYIYIFKVYTDYKNVFHSLSKVGALEVLSEKAIS